MNKQTITFTASEQTLTKTGGIEHYASNIVSYIEASFTLGDNWAGYDSIRAVWKSGYARIATVLDANNKCIVPTEVLTYKSKVNVNLVGSIVENTVLTDRLTTYPILALTVDADARVDSSETTPVTASQFEQFVDVVRDEASAIQNYTYDSEAWAVGQRAGVDVPSTDETYQNNAKYYADQGATLQQEVTDLKSAYGENTLNIWESDPEYTFTQMKQFLLGTPLPAGTYTVIADVASNATNANVSRVRFADSGGTLGTIDLPRKKNAIGYVTISSPCPIIQLYSSNNSSHSSGYSATFSNIRLFSGKQTPMPYKEYIADVSANDQYARNMLKHIRPNNIASICSLAFKYVAADGTLTDNNGLRTSDYIPIDRSFNTLIVSNIVTVSGVPYKIRPVVVFFDANKDVIDVVSDGNLDVVEATIPSTAVYMRINQSVDEAESFCYALYKKTVYEVGAGKEYTSLTACLLALKDDATEKTIKVYGGTYDIFQEYRDANVTRPSESEEDYADWMPYNVLVPENTHIVGIGDVVLQYTPSSSDTYASESKIVSPLNLAGSCTIENITVIGKNCRYCIHDDTMGLKRYANSKKTLKRVKTIKYESDTGLGYRTTNGCGIDGNADYHFEDCDFTGVSRGWYCHTRTSNESGVAYTLAESITLSFKNCTFSASDNGALTLANVPSTQRKVNILLDNCYIDGGIISCDDADISTGTKPNAYDIRMMGCNNASITIRDASNIYTPVVLNTIGA